MSIKHEPHCATRRFPHEACNCAAAIKPAAQHPPMTGLAGITFNAVLAALQEVEDDLDGPQPEDYIGLMERIAAEANQRIENYKAANPKPLDEQIEDEIARYNHELNEPDGDIHGARCPDGDDYNELAANISRIIANYRGK